MFAVDNGHTSTEEALLTRRDLQVNIVDKVR
jgi:hypothetical protein